MDKIKKYVGFGCFVMCFLVLGYSAAMGQQGSFGDPVVNITFGAGTPDFGAGQTTYSRNDFSDLIDGEYTIVSNITQAKSGWHNLSDHTGDPDGMMLVVNASYDRGEFYRIKLPSLCENTVFRFSAWVANANKPIPCPDGDRIAPNVGFVIEDMGGNVVSRRYQTGNINATEDPEWLPFELDFNTGNQTEFQLVLVNENPGGCGNDLAIDDIQFRAFGPAITLESEATRRVGDTLFYCVNQQDPVRLTGHVVASDHFPADPIYRWQSRSAEQDGWQDVEGASSNVLTVIPNGDRWYRVNAKASNAGINEILCRVNSLPIRLTPLELPPTNIRVEVMEPLCDIPEITLRPNELAVTGDFPLTYRWQYEGNGVWEDIPGAEHIEYTFNAEVSGVFRFRCLAVNGCDDRVVVATYEIPVAERVVTELVLTTREVCLDSPPFELNGGRIQGGGEGEYSGTGVDGGMFYPQVAGVGQHTIRYQTRGVAGCSIPAVDVMTVVEAPFLEAMSDISILPGEATILRPNTNGTRFLWEGLDGTTDPSLRYPSVSPLQTTTYQVRVDSDAGCSVSGTVTVVVLATLNIPTGFTPNGDGVNDTWQIAGLAGHPNPLVYVYNRWGQLVFSATTHTFSWDGRAHGNLLPAATYYYVVSSDILDRPVSGSVTILR